MSKSLIQTSDAHDQSALCEDPMLWLRLVRSRRVGPVTFHRLIKEHGSAEAALAALPAIARAAGIENYEICPMAVVRQEIALARKAEAVLLTWAQDAYPASLREIVDAPPILWAIGDVRLLARPMVAMVGARNASSLGIRMAQRLADGLGAAGQVIVSGLARGIDAAAHEASLQTGTIAVLAGGVDVIYPEENAALGKEIGEVGLRLSEQPMGLAPQSRHFPMRNRIVSGLARGVVVVEAASRSGSLITAKTAADQGRDVLVVPGHPFDARAAGCNQLLREGAILVRGTSDVIEALGIMPQAHAPRDLARDAVAVHLPRPTQAQNPTFATVSARDPKPTLPGPVPTRRPLPEMAQVHRLILDRLGPSPLAEDQLIRDLCIPPATLAPALMSLELDGQVLRQSGGLLTRVV